MKKKLKFSHALFWIIFSTVIISGFNYFIFAQVKKYKINRFKDQKYNIKTIAQNQSEYSLNVNYLAELIGLSLDKSTNLFLFDENLAEEKLLTSPLIKDVEIKKVKPNCIFIDYELRCPIASLYDFDNIGIDEDGYTIPIKPFFQNLKLPQIYLDLEELIGFEKIETKEALLALDILNKLKKSGFSDLVRITILDTSRSELKSYGKREIILQLEEEIIANKNNKQVRFIFPNLLRLHKSNYLQQISNYISLREKIMKDYESQVQRYNADVSNIVRFKPKTIDLRISKIAFIDQ